MENEPLSERKKPSYYKILWFFIWKRARWYARYVSLLAIKIYKNFYIEEFVFFLLFLFHRYSPKQFDSLIVKSNVRTLLQTRRGSWLDADKKGKLRMLLPEEHKFFRLKNLLSFGARQSRVEKAVFFTYLTMTLELYNPFDKKLLREFLTRKISLLERLLDKVATINGHSWNSDEIRIHIEIFKRNSLLQYKVIQDMHDAVRRQKPPLVVKKAQEALNRGIFPLLIARGCSGSYWIRTEKTEVAGIFKPFDEEIHAPNNPGGPRMQGAMGQRKTRRGCRIGESAHREVAAFVVDEFFGFGMVPKTYYASFSHSTFFNVHEDRYESRRVVKTKYGSFQEYLSGFEPLDKVSKAEINALPLEEYQLLVMLDLIIGNTDRNTGNILIGDNKIAAVDHGLCFPEYVDRYSVWYWSYYDHGKTPIYSTFINLLETFPYEELGAKLKKRCFLSNRVMDRMRERIALFLVAAEKGLTPSTIADLLIPEHLFPLRDLGSGLKDAAREELKQYIDAGMPKKVWKK